GREGGRVPRAQGAGAQPDAGSAVTPAERERRELKEAIARRDLSAFLRALPSNESERQELLRASNALELAFRAGALAIVQQLLRWDRSTLTARSGKANSESLQHVVHGWQDAEDGHRHGAVDAPPRRDYLELIDMLLAAGANPEETSDWMRPLA